MTVPQSLRKLLFYTLFCQVAASAKYPAASSGGPVCDFNPDSVVSDACATYASLDSLNHVLRPYIQSITQNTDFFSYYRLNLYNKKCPFWESNDEVCGNIACAVNTVDNDSDLPLVWRAQELGKLEGPKAPHPLPEEQRRRSLERPLKGELGLSVGESCVLDTDDECDERDYCVPEDQLFASKGDYVGLVDNPERFTGYAGNAAHHVWAAIYRENCFVKNGDSSSGTVDSGLSPPSWGVLGRNSPSGMLQASQNLRMVMKQGSLQQGVRRAITNQVSPSEMHFLKFDDDCIEKRVFYRVVSGMHASISTHICWSYLNQTTGEWGPNLSCFLDRVHNHPERVSNLYFNFALLLRATGKLRSLMANYQFCSADPTQDGLTKRLIMSLADVIPQGPEIFDENVLFRTPEALGLKDEFRARFRNISRIMDCVGCDKCRLWGKLQTAGYGAALKILFEFQENSDSAPGYPPPRRTELVALINTLGRVSQSLYAIQNFRKLMEERDAGKSQPVGSSHLGGPGKVAMRESVDASKESLVSRSQSTSSSSPISVSSTSPSPLTHHTRKPGKGSQIDHSLWGTFLYELDLLYRSCRYVVWSWIYLPRNVGRILVLEIERLWEIWLGSPAPPRMWEFRLPTRDDL